MSFSFWATRALWLVIPLVANSARDNAFLGLTDSGSGTTMLWVCASLCWLVALLSSAYPHPLMLVLCRLTATNVVALCLLAAVTQPQSALTLTTILGGICLVLVWSPTAGEWFVNGISYGNEYRANLRPPVLAMAVACSQLIVLVLVEIFLAKSIAASNWILVGILTASGIIVLASTIRLWQSLCQRWIIFVPNGIVLMDDLLLTDPLPVLRNHLHSITPALAGSDAFDLTSSAAGLAIEITFAEMLDIGVRNGRTDTRMVHAQAALVTPTRPGKLISHYRSTTPPPTTASSM